MVNKATSSHSQNSSINKSGSGGGTGTNIGNAAGVVGGGKKKKVKRLSNQNTYYLSAFISNPCEQLFGPSLAYSIDLNTSSDQKDKSLLANDFPNLDDLETSTTTKSETTESAKQVVPDVVTSTEGDGEHSMPSKDRQILAASEPLAHPHSQHNNHQQQPLGNHHIQQHQQYNDSNENSFEYIPAPRWNKAQNSILEELFKKSRYPKSAELKQTAQKLHVMDTDVEEWFRKRRGRDRKTRRKNEALKNLIDNYIDK